LAKQGAEADVVTVYRTVASGIKPEKLYPFIEENLVDVVTFTSPSTVYRFLEIMGREACDDLFRKRGIRIAAIGPVTTEAVKKAGFSVNIFQETYTIPGMVEALKVYYSNSPMVGGIER
jgi:uroporphyrinogen III methyltransferase/synthase